MGRGVGVVRAGVSGTCLHTGLDAADVSGAGDLRLVGAVLDLRDGSANLRDEVGLQVVAEGRGA